MIRRTKLLRSKTALKRVGRLRPVSKKRAKANAEYSVRRKAFLAAHPFCQATIKIYGLNEAEIIANDGVAETVAIVPILGPSMPTYAPPIPPWTVDRATEIHHTKKPKCKYLNDESTWLAVSRRTHDFIENNKHMARNLGLLA